jgi:hypothetical protein
MKRFASILLFTLAMMLGSKAFSQAQLADRLYYGGNIGLQFGTVTVINFSPLIGYKFTPRFSAGPSITYMYYNYSSYSRNYFGGGAFARFAINENLFVHTEYELLRFKEETGNPYETIVATVADLYIGAGYKQPTGANSFLNVLLLYNLNQSYFSPYQNPIFRIGFGIGI